MGTTNNTLDEKYISMRRNIYSGATPKTMPVYTKTNKEMIVGKKEPNNNKNNSMKLEICGVQVH